MILSFPHLHNNSFVNLKSQLRSNILSFIFYPAALPSIDNLRNLCQQLQYRVLRFCRNFNAAYEYTLVTISYTKFYLLLRASRLAVCVVMSYIRHGVLVLWLNGVSPLQGNESSLRQNGRRNNLQLAPDTAGT
jgi:hypothetical protein